MDKQNVKSEKKRVKKKESSWPRTSDKEFSKRMFIIFMWAFFTHIVASIISEVFFVAKGSAIEILLACIPVYTTIFASVIVKGGVENVFKGKPWAPVKEDADTSDGEVVITEIENG